MASFWDKCLCCAPGPRRNGGEPSNSNTSEETPLLRSGSSSSSIPNGKAQATGDSKRNFFSFGRSNTSRSASSPKGASQSNGSPSASRADADPAAAAAGSTSPSASTSVAASAQQTAPASPIRAKFTAQELASVTGWARTNLVSVKDATTEEGRNRSSSASAGAGAEGGVPAFESNTEIQALLEKLARGIAFEGWASSSSSPHPSTGLTGEVGEDGEAAEGETAGEEKTDTLVNDDKGATTPTEKTSMERQRS